MSLLDLTLVQDMLRWCANAFRVALLGLRMGSQCRIYIEDNMFNCCGYDMNGKDKDER